MPIDDLLDYECNPFDRGRPTPDERRREQEKKELKNRFKGVSLLKLDINAEDLVPLQRLMSDDFSALSCNDVARLIEMAELYEHGYKRGS